MPFFDQWLAVLKFLNGWHEAKACAESEIREAFREHLANESIEQADTVDRLSGTVVPLLLDLRNIDAAVVKSLGADRLKGLKSIQISILRIVTFELCRERAAKASLKKRGRGNANGNGNGHVPSADVVANAAPHLASDINSLAKAVQHFRFDRSFNKLLQQLITHIRRQKPKVAETPADRSPERAAAQAQRSPT